MIPIHQLTSNCDGPADCACEAYLSANPTSAACFYTHGREIMAKVVAALPTTEGEAVTASEAARRAAAARMTETEDVGAAAARFHLAYAIRDHLVACRRSPGGRYKLWATTENKRRGLRTVGTNRRSVLRRSGRRLMASTTRLVQALWVAEPHHREALLGAIDTLALNAMLVESVDQTGPAWAEVIPQVLHVMTARTRILVEDEEAAFRAAGVCASCLRDDVGFGPTGLCSRCDAAFAAARSGRHLEVVRPVPGAP
jgi:hypothetical protein